MLTIWAGGSDGSFKPAPLVLQWQRSRGSRNNSITAAIVMVTVIRQDTDTAGTAYSNLTRQVVGNLCLMTGPL